MNSKTLAFVTTAALALAACGGGRYGYARSYTFYGDEEAVARRANPAALYEEVQRFPERHSNDVISWFGVVTAVEPGAGGMTRVHAQLRAHQERHLCEDETEGSCRVTINERDGGPFTALVRLAPEDARGENRLQPGSLVRVYGTLVPAEITADSGPVLRSEFYRHWPRGQYVTTAAAGAFRR